MNNDLNDHFYIQVEVPSQGQLTFHELTLHFFHDLQELLMFSVLFPSSVVCFSYRHHSWFVHFVYLTGSLTIAGAYLPEVHTLKDAQIKH